MRIFGDNLSTFSHWLAWSMALVASVFFGFFLFSEDIPAVLNGHNLEMVWFIPCLLIAMAGAICSLWKRIPGGILLLAGGIGMVVFYYFNGGWKEANMMMAYGLPYILPGFLLLIVKK
jgi:hypothetical protein